MIIIIPCFNESDRLQTSLFLTFLENSGETLLIFVNDGSSDDTAVVIKDLEDRAPERIFSLHLQQNLGKAEAVRRGVFQALKRPCQYIGYWDADLATPLSAILQFKECLEQNPQRKIICGSRVRRMGARINRHWYRHYPGRVIATFISMILGLPFYDTQCGAKLIDRSLAEKIFEQPFISPWLFDVELVARIIQAFGRQEAGRKIFELPLESWSDIGKSKISLGYLPRVPYELVKIYRHYRNAGTR